MSEHVAFDFSAFPVLHTARCTLRQLTHADADALVTIFGDEEVRRFLDMEPPFGHEQAIAFIDWMTGHYEQRHTVRWGITLRQAPETVIGTCGFHMWNRQHRRCEVGYDLHRAHWRRGIATEVMQTVIPWCFENLNLNRIEADITSGNRASQRVLEKLGFVYEGTWREQVFEHGRFVDIVQFGLLRREYETNRAANP